MKEKLKKNEGITLIALVITIIVLLILAGVTLSTLFGNNGILTESKLAVESNKEANAKEQVQLAWIACETEYQSAWTQDSSVVKKDYFDADDLNKNLGTGTVKSVNYVESGKSTVTYTLDGTEYEFEIANGQVYKVGQAPDVTEPELTSGKLTDIIKAKNYGDTINYSANGVTDWKIFYNDGENVFIIASECLSADKIPNISTMTKSGNKVYWNNTVENNSGAKGIDTEVAKKFGLNWLFVGNHKNSENLNIKAVQDLMNTSKWNNFATGVSGAQAIGSPTLEMWINSWNAKYPDELLRFNKGETQNSDGSIYEYDGDEPWTPTSGDYGYYVGGTYEENGEIHLTDMACWLLLKSEFVGKDLNNWSVNYIKGTNDSLYFPKGTEYWLSSPSAESMDYNGEDDGQDSAIPTKIMEIGSFWISDDDGSGEWSSYSPSCLRPVVCLPSSVKATKSGAVWNIEE